mmetsp:Transcript_9956/g.22878  ORF Transcript_9956/g.22878 Transcript_9956/m.22878 type:complete len:216 (-) Transcript_9956:567-1214(-)
MSCSTSSEGRTSTLLFSWSCPLFWSSCSLSTTESSTPPLGAPVLGASALGRRFAWLRPWFVDLPSARSTRLGGRPASMGAHSSLPADPPPGPEELPPDKGSSAPALARVRVRRRPQAMIEKRQPRRLPAKLEDKEGDGLCARGTPCLNLRFATEVKANTSPLCWGRANWDPLGSWRKARALDSPKLAPIVKSSLAPPGPYACESWWKGFQSVPSR